MMKVFEILQRDVAILSESQVAERLQSMDWEYEFSDDTRRYSRGQKNLELIENAIYQLWKTKPETAISLWARYCPSSMKNESVTPSFIFRLQAQEK